MRRSESQSYRTLELLCRQQASICATPATRQELERMAAEYAAQADWLNRQSPDERTNVTN